MHSIWQGRNQVYGIRDHSLGIGIMDPGSRVTSDGIRISQFFLSWRGSRIDRFLDTLFFMRNKNIPFCKEKGLFSGLLKKLLTFILQFFYVSVTQSAVLSLSRSYFMLHNFAVSALSDSLRNRILAYRYHAFRMRDWLWTSQGKEVENDGMTV